MKLNSPSNDEFEKGSSRSASFVNRNFSKSGNQDLLNDSKQIDAIQTMESEVKRLAKENRALKRQIKQQVENDESDFSIRLADLDCKLQNVSIERDELTSDISKLKLENENLKRQISSASKNQNEEKILEVEEALKLIEDLVESQSNNIQEFSSQRNNLFTLVQKLSDANIELENRLEKSNMQTTDYVRNYQDLEKRMAEMNEQAEKDLDEILNNIINVSPDEMKDELIKLNENHNITDTKTQIIELFRTIFMKKNSNSNAHKKLKALNDKDKDLQDIAEEEEEYESKYLSRREKALLGHLENAIRFIRLSANSTQSNLNEEERTYVMAQTSRIASFIEEQVGVDGIPDIASLFEMDGPEEQLQTFFDFVDKKDIEDTPVKELYILFKAVIEINSLMYSHFERVSGDAKYAKDELYAQKEENHKLRSQYQDLSEKVEEMREDLVEFFGDENISPFETVHELIKLILKIEGENQQQKKAINDLSKSAAGEKNKSIKFKSENKNSQGEKLENQYNKLKEENKALLQKVSSLDQISLENQKLREEVSNALKKLQALQEEYAALKLNGSEIQKQLESELTKSRAKANEMSQLVDSLREKQSRTETMSVVMTDKERKLKQKIMKLQKRLEQSENSKYSQISQIRSQNEQLSLKYESRIQKLNDELKESRQQLNEKSSEIAEHEQNKISMQRTIARMKLFEKTNEMRLKQKEEQIVTKLTAEKSQYESKLMMMKSQYNSMINEKDTRLINLKEAIIKLVRDHFDDNFIKSTVTINGGLNNPSCLAEDALAALCECLDRQNSPIVNQTFDDASKIRAFYGMRASDSLYSKFNELRTEIDNKRIICEQQNGEINRLIEEIKIARSELAKQSRVRQDLKSWEKWSNAIFRQISDESIPFISTADIRAALEEAIMASIGHRTLRRKIDLLRSEKKILQLQSSLLNEYSPSKSRGKRGSPKSKNRFENLPTLRQLMLVTVFMERLQSFTGCKSVLGCQTLNFSMKPTETRKTSSIIPLDDE